MKKLLASCLGLVLFSNVAFADSHDDQVELELQAIALAQIVQGEAVEAVDALYDRSFLGFDLNALNPISLVNKLKDQVATIKETMLVSCDENGNGKIDKGQEFDNFKLGVKTIFMLVADTDQSGKIDLIDIGALSQLALTKVQEQTLTTICPAVYKQVELSGIFMSVRPVLGHIKDAAE